MSFDASNYATFGRRCRTPSYSSSGSSRSSFSSDYSSGSSYGFSHGLSSMGSTLSLSSVGLSGSSHSSRPPPSSSSFSSRSSREGSFLSSSMMKRDSIINSLVRTSHELTRHDFLPSDAASFRTTSGHLSHRSYRTLDRSRSKTADLTLSSLSARSGLDFSSFSSLTTTSGYGTTYRSTYRPILIQRPTFDNYTPRSREERQNNIHFKSIRRDRPLVKFREKEDVSPEKVRQLLDSWSPETIEENEDEDYETRKRDSVRSNDSGIGSFRSSFGKRSRKKSGEFSSYDLSPTIDEKDSGTEDNGDVNSDRRRCGKYQSIDHVSSVDEGVHMDTEYESRSPRDIVSPLGFNDSFNNNSRPLSRNDVTYEKKESVPSLTQDERTPAASIQSKELNFNLNQETKSLVPQQYSRNNNRIRRRGELDSYKTLANIPTDTPKATSNETVTNRRRERGSIPGVEDSVRAAEKVQVDQDSEIPILKSKTVDKTTMISRKSDVSNKTEIFEIPIPDSQFKEKTELVSSDTGMMCKNSSRLTVQHSVPDLKSTAAGTTESVKPDYSIEKDRPKEADEKLKEKKKCKILKDENKNTEIPKNSFPSPSETSFPETCPKEIDSVSIPSCKTTVESLSKSTIKSFSKLTNETPSRTTIKPNKTESYGKPPLESLGKPATTKLSGTSAEPSTITAIEQPVKNAVVLSDKNITETSGKISVGSAIDSTIKNENELDCKATAESSKRTAAESSNKLKIRSPKIELSSKKPVELLNKTTTETQNQTTLESPAKHKIESSDRMLVGLPNEVTKESSSKTRTEALGKSTISSSTKVSAGLTSKVTVQSPVETKDELRSKTAPIESSGKIKEEFPSKTAVDSLRKLKIESPDKTKVDSTSKAKTELSDRTNIESPSKTKFELPTKTRLDLPSKTKSDSSDVMTAESSGKIKVESPNKTTIESPVKTKFEFPIKPPRKKAVESFDKITVESPVKTKAEASNKTNAESPVKTKFELPGQTIFTPGKTEDESSDKTIVESPGKTKVEPSNKETVESSGKRKWEFPSKTTLVSPIKTSDESSDKTTIESPGKTKEKLANKEKVELPGKTKFELPSKATFVSPGKTKDELSDKKTVELSDKTTVKLSDKTTVESPSKTQEEPSYKGTVESPRKTKFELPSNTTLISPDKTKDKNPEKATVESPGKMKEELPGKITPESLRKKKFGPSDKRITESVDKAKVESKDESLKKMQVEPPVKTKDLSSKPILETLDKTKELIDKSFSKRTVESHNKMKAELPSKTTPELSKKQVIESPCETVTSDLPTKNTDSILYTRTKTTAFGKTKKDVQSAANDVKSRDEPECLKDERPALISTHNSTSEPTSAVGEIAISKSKGEISVKTDIPSHDKSKRRAGEPEHVKQLKSFENSASQKSEINECKSNYSSSEVSHAVPSIANEVKPQKRKECVKMGMATNVDALSANTELHDDKNIKKLVSGKTSIKPDEKIVEDVSIAQKNNSKIIESKVPSDSQNKDKTIPSLGDSKPSLTSPKESPGFSTTEERGKFNISRLKTKAATEKTQLFPQKKLKTERDKGPRLESANNTFVAEEIPSLAKDVSPYKAEKEVNKNLTKHSDTENSKTDVDTQKRVTALSKCSELGGESGTESKFPASPSKENKIAAQENFLSASEKCLNSDATTEQNLSEIKSNVLSAPDLEINETDIKLGETNSTENRKSATEENFKLAKNDACISVDVKDNVILESDRIARDKGNSLPDSEKRIANSESEVQSSVVAQKDKICDQDNKINSDANLLSAAETSEKSSTAEELKYFARGIKKSSSEDFRPDNAKVSGETTVENYILQKSSSAGTEITKRTKPPLPIKTIIPSGFPISPKESRIPQDKEQNGELHHLQKFPTAGKVNFKVDASERPEPFNLRKSSPAGQADFQVDSSASEKLHCLRKSSTEVKMKLKDDTSETAKLYDLKKSHTTECNRLTRKPPIRAARLLNRSSHTNQKKVQIKESITSVQYSSKSDELAHKISLENQSSEIKEILKPKVTESSEDNIPKENKENLALSKNATLEDRLKQTSKESETSLENEVKTKTVQSPKGQVDGDLESISQLITSGDQEKVVVDELQHFKRTENSVTSPEVVDEALLKDATSKKDDTSIPTSRVARHYVPKNRLVISKSDSNVPGRQLMTSSSAPNIAVEKLRAKIAKKAEVSECLAKLSGGIFSGEPVLDIKEKNNLTALTNKNASSKISQQADENQLVSQSKEHVPQATDNYKVLSAISKPSTSENDLKNEPENSSKSVITSQEHNKLEKCSTDNKIQKKYEMPAPEKIETENEIPSKKGEKHEADISEDSSVSTGLKSDAKAQRTENNTVSVELRELESNKTDSMQNTSLTVTHTEQRVTTKVTAKCVQSEQVSVSESFSVETKIEQNIAKEKIDDNKIGDALSGTLSPKPDTDDAGGALDAKLITEEVKPKIKKHKKPKVEGDEKVVKKKKKKKEKLDITEGKSDIPSMKVESTVKENVECNKSAENSTIAVPSEKQRLPDDIQTPAQPEVQRSSDTNRRISEASEQKPEIISKTEDEGIHSKKDSDLSAPSPGVTNEASATTDTYSLNICSLTPPQSPAISDPEDVCDHLWSENKRSESSESFRQSKNSSVNTGTIRFKKYSPDDFHFLKVLGRGSYGKVMLAEVKGSSQYFAIKCLKKDVVLEDNDVECTMIEKKVLAMGSTHPYLCTLFCTFQSESHLFFVMEYLSGGDLMFHIQQSGRFEQERAKFYAAEIVCALKYLHKRGIVYRDAKLDNICLDSDGHVRLVDFGFCKLRIYRKECLPRNLCGTPDYMAPEIIKGHHYNQSVDWWSFGVLLYEMLIGQSPFNGTDEEELFWSVCNEDAYYPRFISKEAKHILVLLLEKNPEKRLGMPGCTAGDISHQPFFRLTDWEKVEKKEVEPPFKPKLKSETDVSNFDSDFTMEKAMLTPIDKQILDSMDQSQFAGFSYTNPRITD